MQVATAGATASGVATEPAPSTTTSVSVEDELNDCWKCQGSGTVTKKVRSKRLRKHKPQVLTAALLKPGVRETASGSSTDNDNSKPVAPVQVNQGHVELHTVKCPVCQGSKRLASRKRRLALAGQDKACATVTKRVGMPGWTRPGPPATGADDPRATIGTAEQVCCLVGRWRIFQQIGGYRYSTDDVVTSWVAATTMRRLFSDSHLAVRRSCDGTGSLRRLHCADIGCGIGSVLLMTAWMLRGSNAQPQPPNHQSSEQQRNCTEAAGKDPLQTDSSLLPVKKMGEGNTLPCVSVGVEAQPSRLALAHKSIIYNGTSDRVAAIHGDLRDLIPERLIQNGAQGSSSSSVPEGGGATASRGADGQKVDGRGAVGVSPAILHGAIPVGDGGDGGVSRGSKEASPLPSKILSTVRRLCNGAAEPIPAKAASSGVAIFDLVTGTPPYFDVKQGGLGAQVASAKCLFEYRGGIEAYCLAARELLKPCTRARFVVAETSTVKGIFERVHNAAVVANLVIDERVDVCPKEGKAILFSVYVMKHAEAECNCCTRTTERPATVPEVPPSNGSAVAPYRIRIVTVRDAGGDRTLQYRQLLDSMGIPPRK